MSHTTAESNAGTEFDAKTRKIIDLNQNVLEKVFEYLNLSDLLNIVDTSKQFKQPADWIFRSKYGKSKMIFWAAHASRCNHPVWQTDNIYIDDFTMCLKILRCFGHLIPKLDLNYLKINEKKCNEIDYYIVKYCTALTDVTFKHVGESTLNCMVKSFEKIEKLSFEDSCLSGKLSDLNKWFPRMCVLELKFYMRIEKSKCLEKHFPYLESLTIDGQVNNVCWSDIINTLHLNPQLRRLCISDYFDMKFLQMASKHLHFLENLTILKWTEDEFTHEGEFVNFKNVRNLTIDFSRLCKVPQIPLRFDQLEALTVDAIYMCRFNDNFINFMRNHTSIRKLKIVWQNYAFQRKITNSCNAIFKEKLAQVSSYLWEIDLGACIFTLDEAISFLKQCKSLKRFCLSLNQQSEYEMLGENLGEEWKKCTENQNYIRMKRSPSPQYK